GAFGGELEEDAAGLAEVDRLEPEPVDRLRRLEPDASEQSLHRALLGVVADGPRGVVDAAGAAAAAPLVRHHADLGERAARAADAVAVPAVLLADLLEAHHAGEQHLGGLQRALPHPHGVEPAHLVLGRNRAALPRREGALLLDPDEREPEPVRVLERERPLAEARLHLADRHAVLVEPLAPEAEAR